MSGYDIKKSCQQFLGHFWDESFGQIYPVLKRLEENGAVEIMTGPEPGNRNRRVYRITATGHGMLQEWLNRSPASRSIRDELLLKLSCGNEVDREVHIRHLKQARDEALKELQEFVQLEIAYLADYRSAPDLPYWLITLRAGRSSREARVRWCDESIATLKA
jgi:DNA-binding PadR family transcriptional regulator